MCLQMFWGRGRGYFFRSAEKPEGYGIEREAKIIGYMHMYKRNHMEGQDSGIKRILSSYVVSS